MHHETWQRLGSIFLDALERPAADRAAWLDEACRGDASLRAEIEAMLEAHGDGDSDRPECLLPSAEPAGAPLEVGTRLGPWRIDALVGRGGMGEVYRATRADDQFQQQVAIKVVRPERATPELVRRFLQERQIMARLEHPNIAALLDGGLAAGGQPYLVMQYVEGVSVTRYAVEHHLDLEACLRLFVTICDAVQFAHRHLIVHRDLKPSNVLVSGDGVPRLLDFGIAKLLDTSSAASTTGDLLLLTPEHAAPEQFLGNAITTATDVYALGVLLYELLTGTRPFRNIPATALPRAVCEQAPPPPSSVRPVDADLEQVVLMALRKEPDRRYASAGALGADVLRFLGGWPVVAQADTAGYRVRRFVGRNRLAVGAAAAVVLTLAGATVAIARQSAHRATALEVAEAERSRATRITNFLLGTFRATNPNETRGRTVTARELLDQAAARVRADLALEPGARADMELAIGQAYGFLGQSRTADTILTRVMEDRRAMSPQDSLALATAIEWHARTRMTLGDLRYGRERLQEVLTIRERLLGPDAVELAPVLQRIGSASEQLDPEDKDSTAYRSLQRAIDIHRAQDPVDGKAVADLYRFMAVLVSNRDEYAEGLRLMREAVATASAATDQKDPFLFNLRETLALFLKANGFADSAIAVHRQLLEARREVFGPESDDVSFSLFNLARDLSEVKQFEEAMPLFRECIRIREKLYGPEHIQVGYATGAMARAIAWSGDPGGAIPVFERAARIGEAAVGPANMSVMGYYEDIARARLRLGQRDAAIAALTTLAERGYKGFDKEDWQPLAADPRFARLRRE